jgi:hypothetical protein
MQNICKKPRYGLRLRDAALRHNQNLNFYLITAPVNYNDSYPKRIPYNTGYPRR